MKQRILALLLIAVWQCVLATTLIIDGVRKEGMVVITTVGSPPAPTPTSTPVTPPVVPPGPTASCGPGEAMMSGDLIWSSLHETQLWPIPAVTGLGESGRAIQFVADSAAYPRGVQLQGVDESQPAKGKDYVVSGCAHSFTPVDGNALCAVIGAGSTAGPIYLRFGPAEPRTFFGRSLPTLDCPLSPGGIYYINFRDNATAYGSVSSQFVVYKRSD